MKLDQLSYFLETAKQQHIGRAARALAISPSAISHSISSLEDELGRSLFVKRGRHIALTSHGKLLMEEARRLLWEVERVREEISSDHIELRGNYKIAGTHTLAARLLAPAWARVQNRNPKLTAEIYSLRSAEVIQGVISGEIDFGVCFNPQDHPDIDSRCLGTGRLLIAVKQNHPLMATVNAKRLALLSRYPAVLPKAFRGVDVCERHPIFKRFNIVANPNCLIDNYEVAAEKIRNSLCWGFLPDYFIQSAGLVALKPPQGWDATYSIMAIWKKDQFLTRAIRELIEAISVNID